MREKKDLWNFAKMVVANTLFKHEKRRRYSWKRPGDSGRYQLDYILVRQRYRNTVKNDCSYPGADTDTDHNLVIMTAKVKLKKLKKGKKIMRWNLDMLNINYKGFQERVEEHIVTGGEGVDIEGKWQELKKTVLQSAESEIGYHKRVQIKKPWVTEEMLKKMDKRRKWKCITNEDGKRRYKILNNELRRKTERARESWWNSMCEDLEKLDKEGRSDKMYQKIKQITGQRKTMGSATVIQDVNGNLLSETEEVKGRWKEHIEALYNKEGKLSAEEMDLEKEHDIDEVNIGPSILKCEIRAAVHVLKKGKAVGVDGIPAEFWKNLGDGATAKLVELCKEIYEKGKWPYDFQKTMMIPLQKKVNATACEDYRTISLITHGSKILPRVLAKRLETKAEDYIGKNQFGFRKGHGTREAIGVMRMLSEKAIDHDNELFVCLFCGL